MSNHLPVQPDLSYLRKLAKELLAQARCGEPVAVKRFEALASRSRLGPADLRLNHAQFVLAREHGFESWPKLVAEVEARSEEGPLKKAIGDLRRGRLCILFDDEGRENEGDLVLAAEMVSPEKINFLTKHARGTLCLALDEEQAGRLGLKLVRDERADLAQPAFMHSIDAAGGITTGVSAFDRAETIRAAVAEDATPRSVRSPGHVFPLLAHGQGLSARQGHTEGSVELMKRAGLKPAAVISEILNADGRMARWSELESFAREHDLAMVRVSDLLGR